MGAAVILGNWLGPRISTYLIPVTRALDLIRLVAYHVPFGWPRRPQQTSFAPGEDPVRYVMEEVGSVYPRINQSWPDKTSDEALAHFCRCGVAAHRTELATAAEQDKYTDASGNRAKFAVRTNGLAMLEVKEGCDRYGGNVYFGADWRPICIVRLEPPAGEEWWEELEDVIYRPGEGYRWEYAKFCFRSSLFTLITFVDHLFQLHMQTSELVTLATREQLSTDHPIRRFLVPFTFGAITINDWARTALCAYGAATHRAFSFTDCAFARAWALAPKLAYMRSSSLWFGALKPVDELETPADHELWLDRFLSHHSSIYPPNGVDSPFFTACQRYHSILKRWVEAYCSHCYPEGVGDGDEVVTFLRQIIATTVGSTDIFESKGTASAEASSEMDVDASARVDPPSLDRRGTRSSSTRRLRCRGALQTGCARSSSPF